MQALSAFKVGETFGQRWQFDEKSVAEFANLVGDYNPLHHDKQTAEKSRFKKLIVSGTQYTAIMMGLTATFVSQRQPALGLSFDFQFKKAIFADEWVDMQWQVMAIDYHHKLNGYVLEMAGKITNSQGEICTTAQAKLLSCEQI